MSTDTKKHKGSGNTKSPSSTPKRTRNWCFTLNNWLNEDWVRWTTVETQQTHKTRGLIVGKEVGEKGTPHLQGYVEFTNAKSFEQAKTYFGDRYHIEMRKSKKQYEAIAYCKKEKNYFCNFICCRKKNTWSEMQSKYAGVVWKPWQQEIIELVGTTADNRTINWYWDTGGNVGKSFLAKYLVLTFQTIIGQGKSNDIFHQINKYIEAQEEAGFGCDFDLCLVDMPRHNIDYLNYGMLEQIKNGMIYSGKYEGGVQVFNPPHLVVFANSPPDSKRMSADRWNVVCLDDVIIEEEEIGFDDDLIIE